LIVDVPGLALLATIRHRSNRGRGNGFSKGGAVALYSILTQ